MDFSPVQMLMVLVIALIVFGPKRLPEMARNLGKAVNEFKSGISLGDDGPTSQAPRAPAPAPPAVTAPAAPAAPAAASGDVLGGVLRSGEDQPDGAR